MHVKRQREIELKKLKNEFKILKESDYWQYLPESTKDDILAMLGEHKWRRYLHQEVNRLSGEDLNSAPEKLLKV